MCFSAISYFFTGLAQVSESGANLEDRFFSN